MIIIDQQSHKTDGTSNPTVWRRFEDFRFLVVLGGILDTTNSTDMPHWAARGQILFIKMIPHYNWMLYRAFGAAWSLPETANHYTTNLHCNTGKSDFWYYLARLMLFRATKNTFWTSGIESGGWLIKFMHRPLQEKRPKSICFRNKNFSRGWQLGPSCPKTLR